MERETYLYGRGGGSGAYFLTFVLIVLAGGIVIAGPGSQGLHLAGRDISPGLVTLGYLLVAGFGGWLAFGEVQSERFTPKTARPIQLDATGLTAPAHPDARRTVKLAYSDITKLSVDTRQDRPVLHLTHKRGKLMIPADAMESLADFNKMLTTVEVRVMLARGTHLPGS